MKATAGPSGPGPLWGKNFRRPQIFSLEILGPKVVLLCKFSLYRAVRAAIGARAPRLQPHQPHGWSGSDSNVHATPPDNCRSQHGGYRLRRQRQATVHNSHLSKGYERSDVWQSTGGDVDIKRPWQARLKWEEHIWEQVTDDWHRICEHLTAPLHLQQSTYTHPSDVY